MGSRDGLSRRCSKRDRRHWFRLPRLPRRWVRIVGARSRETPSRLAAGPIARPLLRGTIEVVSWVSLAFVIAAVGCTSGPTAPVQTLAVSPPPAADGSGGPSTVPDVLGQNFKIALVSVQPQFTLLEG